MIVLTVIGLIFVMFSYQFPILESVTTDILPAFVGFLLLWHVGNKLTEKTKWFKETSVWAAALAAVHFIGFASSFRTLLPQNTTFADSDIFRFIFMGVGYVYENGALIFTALGFICLQFLCRAFGNIAENNENQPMTIFYLIFSWIFIVLIPVYTVANFITFPFELWTIVYPIDIIFIVVSAIFMKKYNLD